MSGVRLFDLVLILDRYLAVGTDQGVEQQVVEFDGLAVEDDALNGVEPVDAQLAVGSVQPVRAVRQLGPPDAPARDAAGARIAADRTWVLVRDPASDNHVRRDQPALEREFEDASVQRDFALNQSFRRGRRRSEPSADSLMPADYR